MPQSNNNDSRRQPAAHMDCENHNKIYAGHNSERDRWQTENATYRAGEGCGAYECEEEGRDTYNRHNHFNKNNLNNY